MKRLLLGIFLGGCTVGAVEPVSHCERVGSTVKLRPDQIVSGRGLIGVSWDRDDGHVDEVHGAIVRADGTISPDIFVREHDRATAGTATVLWYPTTTQRPDVDVTLDLGGEVVIAHIADAPAIASGAIFDGNRYQIFWRSGDAMMHHRSLSETGELGPVHVLAVPPAYHVSLATDHSGTTLARIGAEAFVVDPTSGSVQRVFSAEGIDDALAQTFWFAGRFHIFDRGRLWSFDAASTETRTLSAQFYFVPGTTRLYAGAPDQRIVELDASFNVIRDGGERTSAIGTLDDDLVRFVETPQDVTAGEPASIALVRADAWQRVVTTSPDPVDVCP